MNTSVRWLRRPTSRRDAPGASTTPWLDREDADIGAYVASVPGRNLDRVELARKLQFWRENGYVIFPGLIPESWIDTYLEDVEELLSNHDRHRTRMHTEGVETLTAINELTLQQVTKRGARIADFHNQSVAAKKIILSQPIVSFIEHLFRDRVVAMQTLTFRHGSEQPIHQDRAFVVADVPDYLCATWIALEDVHVDAGPLLYYPGSHGIKRFDFGNGPFLTDLSTRTDLDFRDFIEAECAAAQLECQMFAAKKGDVLCWHGELAHGGAKVNDRNLTRMSLVAHYSALTAYPVDRRDRQKPPTVHQYNRGLVYSDPNLESYEDTFRRGRRL